jgi:hypothetical protein
MLHFFSLLRSILGDASIQSDGSAWVVDFNKKKKGGGREREKDKSAGGQGAGSGERLGAL